MRLSQVFLSDKRYIDKIVSFINPHNEDVFLEVGPGMGNFTFEFLSKGCEVVAIEVDKFFCEMLRLRGVDVICEDYLKVNVEGEIRKRDINPPIRFFSSVPYHITHSMLIKVCKERRLYSDIHLILQMEVAKKITSQVNTKSYGAFSVLMQALFQISLLFNIPNTAFSPRPRVHSSLVKLIPKPEMFHIDENRFLKMLNAFFKKRRRKMKNVNPHIPGELRDLRPENVPVNIWINLYISQK